MGAVATRMYAGPNPVQVGAAPDAFEPHRTAIIRGQVRSRNGTALPAVRIRVHGNPQFGETVTRADGGFDLAVNGGGTYTLDYERTGYLPVQRQVQAAWQSYVFAPDAVLTPLDPNATAIALDSGTIQIAQGSTVTDESGTRRATLLFRPGTTATLELADSVQPISVLTVRATEYTVGVPGPAAMPATLPPSSGYTYAIEFSVDEALAAGAKSVRFSKPVIHYVENFLGFPTGERVPTGYYDRDVGCWVPSDNGRVVRILEITGGRAMLDADGDGAADTDAQLTALGVEPGEQETLAGLYGAGATLWRVPIPHFSPWDCNWPYGPPEDASGPTGPGPRGAGPGGSSGPSGGGPSGGGGPSSNGGSDCGSIIDVDNQILGESLGISGTPFRLHYHSDRVRGYRVGNVIQIPLIGDSVPPSLRSIGAQIEVAGRKIDYQFPAAPSQQLTFEWDGLDRFGQLVSGRHDALVTVRYTYPAIYQRTPDQFDKAFAKLSGIPVLNDRDRGEVSIARRTLSPSTRVGTWDAFAEGLGGWTIGVHHGLDAGQTVFLGNGRRRDIQPEFGGIETVQTLPPGDRFRFVAGPDGTFYFGANNGRFLRIHPDGTTAEFGPPNFTGGMAISRQGTLIASYFRDDDHLFQNPLLAEFLPDGSSRPILFGLEAWDLAVGPDGCLYFTQSGTNANRIYKHDCQGDREDVVAIAGVGGPAGFGGDGGPALEARFASDGYLAIARDGTIYLSDTSNNRIRSISPFGLVATVAGTGEAGFSGDGGDPRLAKLQRPERIVVDDDGTIYFRDLGNNRVRMIRGNLILTVAGNGIAESTGDGGPALGAGVFWPDLALGPDRALYLMDRTAPRRLRRVTLPARRFASDVTYVPSLGGRELFVFDPRGRHLQTLDGLTGAVRYGFTYGANGLLERITDRAGNATIIERDLSGTATAIVASGGQRTTLVMDAARRLAAIRNPAGDTKQFTYTADALLETATDARGKVTEFSYDALGRLTGERRRDGGQVSLSQSVSGGVVTVARTSPLLRTKQISIERLPGGDLRRTVTDQGGLETVETTTRLGEKIRRNPNGTTVTTLEGPDPRFGMRAPIIKSASVTTPGGRSLVATASRTASFDPADPSRLIAQTDTMSVNGVTTSRSYDGSSRTLTHTTSDGRQVAFEYDTARRPTRVRVADLEPISYTYDPASGRAATIAVGTGLRTRLLQNRYDARHRLVEQIDSLGRSQKFSYDDAGRLLSREYPGGTRLELTYDGNGNVTSVTPPGRGAHAYAYSPLDREASYTAPEAGGVNRTTFFEHNLDRQLARVTKPDGSVIELGRDAAGRLESVLSPNGEIRYAHDQAGRVASMAMDGTTVGFTYDGPLPLSATWTGAVAGNVAWTYDDGFRIASEAINGGAPVTFEYDGEDRIARVGAMTFTRSPSTGFVSGSTIGVVATTRRHDSFAELEQLEASANGSAVLDIRFGRDLAGRIVGRTESIGGSVQTYAYAYDDAGRLREVLRDGVSLARYGYDANGNRLFRATASGQVDASYDGQDRLLQHGSVFYTYTANGEVATKADQATGAVTTYSYDGLGNLRRVVLPGGNVVEYLIDAKQRRIGKKLNGVLVQSFIYRDGHRVGAELGPGGQVLTRFVYGDNAVLPEYIIKNGVNYRMVADHLGSPRLLVHAGTGAIVQRLDFDEAGAVTLDTDPGFQPLGYVGGIFDRDTGLVHLGVRDLDPATGRWMSKDPTRFAGGPNLYVYAAGDPINLRDTDGRSSSLAIDAPTVAGLLAAAGETLLAAGAAVGGLSTAATVGIGAAVVGVGVLAVCDSCRAALAELGQAAAKDITELFSKRLPGEKMKDGTAQDAIDNLDEIEERQTGIRKGKAPGIIDDATKSKQRMKERLRRIKSSKDIADEQAEDDVDNATDEAGDEGDTSGDDSSCPEK